MDKIYLTLIIVLLIPFVSAYNVDVNDVFVNGINVDEGSIQVESGNVPITIYLYGNEDIDDVRLKVWVGGYDYGDIVEYSEMFDIEDGVLYKKTLSLDIPNDIDSGDYTLHLDVFDSNSADSYEYDIFVESENKYYYRHREDDGDVYVSVGLNDLVVNQDNILKVQVTNYGSDEKFYLKVNGVLVDSISVPEGSTGEFAATLNPSSVGSSNILVQVYSSDELIMEKSYLVDVVEDSDYYFYIASLFVGVIVILGLLWYLRRYRE